MKRLALVMALTLVFLAGGCSWSNTATSFNGMRDMDGNTVKHVSTTNLGINLLFTKPLVGDATLDGTVSSFTEAAKAADATQVRIVQSHVHTMWYILPPISFVVQPVLSNVAGDVK